MRRAPHQILETVETARAVMDNLSARVAAKRNVTDLGDLTLMRTTVRQIEQLLASAAEYEVVLSRRLDLVAARHE